MMKYLQLAPCLFFAATDDGQLLEVNDKLCTCLLYEPGELQQEKLEFLFTLPTRIFQQTHFFPLLKLQGHAEEIFITLRKKDGSPLPVLLNAERRMINGTYVCLYTGIVVENRKKFEEELIAARNTAEKALVENTALQQARQQLMERAEALEKQMQLVARQNDEMRQFNRVVTHDLREPLRKLALFSSMLASGQPMASKQDLVEKIHKNLANLSEIVSGLQRYVWLQEGALKLEEVDLNSLLAQVVQQLQSEWPGMNLQLQATGLTTLQADRTQLQLLLYELLTNAIRFRKESDKAEVIVTGTTVSLNAYQQLEGAYRYTDFLRLQVMDKGIGFVGEYGKQIFELFKRLHPQSGRGIGLPLCKLVAQNHGGRIEVDSGTGAGTTVTVYLQLYPETTIKQEVI